MVRAALGLDTLDYVRIIGVNGYTKWINLGSGYLNASFDAVSTHLGIEISILTGSIGFSKLSLQLTQPCCNAISYSLSRPTRQWSSIRYQWGLR